MQRAAFPEPDLTPRARRHRRGDHSDRVLTGLKVATFLAGAGLLAVIILLASAGSSEQPAAKRSPEIPRITPSSQQPSTGVPAPTASSVVLAPPELRTDTAEIAGAPPPAPPSQPSKPRRTSPQRPGFQFAVIGARCTDVGAFSVTKDYQPVICMRRPPREDPRWFAAF